MKRVTALMNWSRIIGNLLEQQLAGIDGSLVERKKFSIMVHYRLVAADQVGRVNEVIDALMKNYQGSDRRQNYFRYPATCGLGQGPRR